ncbi:RNA-binding cell elongation regulator Jag/EloR [Desulfobacterales bacterium HSG16]|nr:RNA-binding cell elongation regulator Jag/EloR [Desulfobacterales bacterium HSG16]
MSSALEFEDKIIEKAIEKACKKLKVSRENLDYDVISYGSSGIFGLVGVKKAKIRVSMPNGKTNKGKKSGRTSTSRFDEQRREAVSSLIRETFNEGPDTENESQEHKQARPSGDKNDKNRTRKDKNRFHNKSRTSANKGRVREDKPRVSKDKSKVSDDKGQAGGDKGQAREDKAQVSEDKGKVFDDKGQTGGDKGQAHEDKGQVHEDKGQISEDKGQAHEDKGQVSEDKGQVSEKALKLGIDGLQKIIDLITADAKVSVDSNSERLLFDVRGGNSAVLIGKRGKTLEDIQYLIEKIINKHNDERVRVQVDIEGYLDNKKNRLISLALRLAEKAKRTGKPVTIGQMNAHDRRIIHIALKDETTVRTQSMGDGFYRKLVILPKRNNRPRKKTV